ncbi:UNVERIFIED_CONTAM: hypothetical protein GTU68_066241 [Idotea baltica]|nr:hypothetical protein [Idotea baltica]MCL4154209.1 hypothetical protein [Idotea baltica]
MVPKHAFVAFLLLGLFSSRILETEAQESEIVSAIVNQLMRLWRSDNIQFLDHSCRYRLSPKMIDGKLMWGGKFWCPSWAFFTGRALDISQSAAIEGAVRDFATQAVIKNLVKKSEVDKWIEGKSP